MFKTITNREEFIKDPVLEMDISNEYDIIHLFGKNYKMYKDIWKHHVHLKCTNICDSNCAFCIERESRYDNNNRENFIRNCKALLTELNDQRMLYTVSVTGGEPTVAPHINEIISLVNNYNLTLFSINTNGRYLNKLNRDSFNGWINISKHSIHDNHIFNRDFEITPDYLRFVRDNQKNAKIRFQCVLGIENGLKSISEIKGFLSYYNDVVDDFSFRSLIVDKKEDEIPHLFREFRDWLFPYCIEQTIQDYYVYEIYNVGGYKPITISWSNMYLLKKYNETNSNNFLEEIIVHPDGMIAGSWNKKSLIIKS